MNSKKVVLIVMLSLLASKGWSESQYFCNTEHAISLFKSGKTYNKLDTHFLTQFNSIKLWPEPNVTRFITAKQSPTCPSG